MSLNSVNNAANAIKSEQNENIQIYVETEKSARAVEYHALHSLKANLASLEEYHKRLAFVLSEVEYQIRKR